MSQLENNESIETSPDSIDALESSSSAEGQEVQNSDNANNNIDTNEVNIKEKEVYKEVLEKLNVNSGEKANDQFDKVNQAYELQQKDIQEKFMQNNKADNFQNQAQIENIVVQDFLKIENLMRLGLINQLQGANLKEQVMKKAFDMSLQNGLVKQNLSTAASMPNKNEIFNEFNKSNPNFFQSEGRKEVLDYLKSDDVIIGKDDLKKISSMIANIEKTAIDRYLKKEAYQKTLKESNESAKQKLRANAQNSNFTDKNFPRTFTREQIGKMSSAEFSKYEPVIMDQLKKGLIK